MQRDQPMIRRTDSIQLDENGQIKLDKIGSNNNANIQNNALEQSQIIGRNNNKEVSRQSRIKSSYYDGGPKQQQVQQVYNQKEQQKNNTLNYNNSSNDIYSDVNLLFRSNGNKENTEKKQAQPNKQNGSINRVYPQYNLNNNSIDQISDKKVVLTKYGKNIQASSMKHSKVPEVILRSIAQKTKQIKTKPALLGKDPKPGKDPINNKKKKNKKQKSKLTQNILSSIRSIRKKFVCEICVCEYSDKNRKKIGKCQHSFCDGCLRQYAEYKIARFEEVVCPSELCPEVLDITGEFYATLSPSLREKYLKVHTFHQAAQNNQRLCPDEKCKDGVLTVQEGSNPRCNKCSKVFCRECFFPEHEGSCGQNEVDFFQNNFKFRQCAKCKAVVEKKEGCNHITCRCKYEFCYLCGKKWLNYEHRCDGANAGAQQTCCQCPNCCCQCIECDCQCLDCHCLRQNQCCSTILKFFLKLLLSPLFLLILVVHVSILCLAFLFLLLITLILGMFPYTVDIVCQLQGCIFLLAVLLYPITMFLGIGKCFGEFFCEVYGGLLGEMCAQLGRAFEGIFLW